MSHDERVWRAIHLLELVSSSEDSSISAAEAREELSCDDVELDGYIELISTLADRERGLRAVIYRDGDTVAIMGDAAQMSPLRLSLGESIALESVLGTLDLGAEVTERLRSALVPDLLRNEVRRHLIGRDISFGSWYRILAEAIADGVRCRVSYRSHDDASSRERTVDPLDLETTTEAAYLVAWDIDKDAERRYRLERIEGVTFTEDSVVPHQRTSTSISESLAQGAYRVVLELPHDEAERLSWAGIRSLEEAPVEGFTRVRVDVSSMRWLFDQVLAAGGSMHIVAPPEMIPRFVTYAQSLAVTTD